MTRAQAEANLKTIGIEEPTEDQITNYLNQLNGETKRANDRADKLKADADKVSELQEQLDALNNQNLSDIEKANKATEQANAQIVELQKQLLKMQTMKSLADRGITGDDAENFFNEDGSVNFETLGKIISDRETKASAEKEKEILNGTPNPQGAGNGNQGDAKPADVENAERLYFGEKAVGADIKDYYVLGKQS